MVDEQNIDNPFFLLQSCKLSEANAEEELKKIENDAPWNNLNISNKIIEFKYINNIDEIIIIAKAIDPNNFFPNLSIKVEVKGVNNIDEIPNEPIKTPMSDLVNPCSSKKSGSKKNDEKFTKNKKFAIVDNKKFLFRLNI